MLIYEQLTELIFGAAIEVHRELGPGSLESAYEECLCQELTQRGLAFQQQLPLPVIYKGHRINCGYRLDIIVDDKVIVEVKAIKELAPIHEAQLLTYLKLTGKRVGLLMNFNVPLMKHGIKRMVL